MIESVHAIFLGLEKNCLSQREHNLPFTLTTIHTTFTFFTNPHFILHVEENKDINENK